MTINSWFYDSVNNDRPYSASDFAKAFATICSTGVILNDDGTTGFDIGGTNFTTMYEGKAFVEGYFVHLEGTELLTVTSGTYAGQIVLRVNMTDTRMAEVVVKTSQNPQQDDTMYELPLYNVTVTNGVMSAPVDLRTQGGAVASLPPNAITWQADPNGIFANMGYLNGTGKPIKLFLTSAQPSASSTEIRAWIQIDKF